MKKLDDLHWDIYSTENTHDYLAKNGVGSVFVYKACNDDEPNIKTIITNHEVDLIVNIPRAKQYVTHDQITDGYVLRRMAIDHHIPLITNVQTAQLMLECLAELPDDYLKAKSWNEYVGSHSQKETIDSLEPS